MPLPSLSFRRKYILYRLSGKRLQLTNYIRPAENLRATYSVPQGPHALGSSPARMDYETPGMTYGGAPALSACRDMTGKRQDADRRWDYRNSRSLRMRRRGPSTTSAQ